MKFQSVVSAESLPFSERLYLDPSVGTIVNQHFSATVCSNVVFAQLFLHR